jgi:hypothetical protein
MRPCRPCPFDCGWIVLMATNQQFGTSAVFEELDALSRERRLTAAESRKLEKALRRLPHDRFYKRWTDGEKDRLRRYLLRGKKPKEIAILMSVSERAIWRMMYKLGWTVRKAENGSIVVPIGRSKIRIDTRKWIAAKLKPKKYGDRQLLGSDPENPLPASVTVSFRNTGGAE